MWLGHCKGSIDECTGTGTGALIAFKPPFLNLRLDYKNSA